MIISEGYWVHLIWYHLVGSRRLPIRTFFCHSNYVKNGFNIYTNNNPTLYEFYELLIKLGLVIRPLLFVSPLNTGAESKDYFELLHGDDDVVMCKNSFPLPVSVDGITGCYFFKDIVLFKVRVSRDRVLDILVLC